MKMTKLLSLALCAALAAAMLLSGCSSKTETDSTDAQTSTEAVAATAAATEASTDASSDSADAIEIGEGDTQFTFVVTDGDGVSKTYSVNTNETTVGAALLNLELISGEDSSYGLYVKTVDGITADYDVDGTYWAFYIDGEYAQTGVDSTEITAGSVYTFAVESAG
jgi:outer membrane murein-binding lipoprotein Lpp